MYEVLCDDGRISALTSLDASHLWEVLPLPTERRWELLVAAHAERRSSRDLHLQVAAEFPRRRRRAALRTYLRFLRRFGEFLRAQESLRSLDEAGPIPEAEVEGVLDDLTLASRAADDQTRLIAAKHGREAVPPFRKLLPDGSRPGRPRGEEKRTIEALARKVESARKPIATRGAR